jgi:SHS2 domain-containing protein
MKKSNSGYREVEHTADWELQAWAPDLVGLLEQAARGMYALSGVQLAPEPREPVSFSLPAEDPGRLVVSFLSELLWLGEQEGLGFDVFELSLANDQLFVRLVGAPIVAQSKEIKAVTYHNLAISRTDQGLQVNIVFDV